MLAFGAHIHFHGSTIVLADAGRLSLAIAFTYSCKSLPISSPRRIILQPRLLVLLSLLPPPCMQATQRCGTS